MYSYSPMPSGCDVPSVLSLARSVANDFSRAPDVFRPGEEAANALASELNAFQRFRSSRTTGSQADGADESPLAAHLMPCRTALQNMLDIRRKYPGQTMGRGDSFKWKLDKKRFAEETAALRQATSRLRETVQLLQTAALGPQPSTVPSARAFESHVSVSIGQGPAMFQATPPRSSTASLPATPGNGPAKPMCPRGSGCREPYCYKKHSHPSAPDCEEGKDCCVPGCIKFHPKSPHCPNGPDCPWIKSGCSKAHPWPRSNDPSPSLPTPQTPPTLTGQGEYGGRASAASGTTSSTFPAPTLVTGESLLHHC
jgi:hypothetical protein